MIPDEFVIQIGVHLLEAWLLTLGFQPSGDWDADDPACLSYYNPYYIIGVQAHVTDGGVVDTRDLFLKLQDYLDDLAQHPGAVRFVAFDVEEYQSDYFGKYIFARIYY